MTTRQDALSPWILHFDTGSCNGCDIEIWALLTPKYDVERFGMINKGNPKHADILLVTGPVTKKCASRLKNLYDQMPDPKLVVACGDCASTGAPYVGCYNICGGVDAVIPVDVYVPGCACRPEVLIDGVVMALQKWKERIDPVPEEAKA
jgi:ech hydrogenase subunit C